MLAGIESGKLALCPDGSRIDETNCDDAGQSSSGGSGGPEGMCNAPWQRGDSTSGRCYLQEYGPRDWSSAEQRCVDLGGHLLAIDSENELELLADWIDADMWIGGTDADKEGEFTWTNGQAWTFASWIGGAPIDFSGNRDCVMLKTLDDREPAFACRFCSEKHGYICESEPMTP